MRQLPVGCPRLALKEVLGRRSKSQSAILLSCSFPSSPPRSNPAHSKLLNTSVCSLNHFEDVHRRRGSGRLRPAGQTFGHGPGGLLHARSLIEARVTEVMVPLIVAGTPDKLNPSLLAGELPPF